MKKKIIKLCKMINSDKKTRILVIIFVMLSFIFTLGYSLSIFTASKEASVVNINVNGLVFNLTTNAGESDDRILKLAAGMTESFDVNITNLNNINVKYELLYDVCKDVNCKEKLNGLPANVQVALNMLKTKTANGLISPGSNNAKKISLITINNTENDYYIKLNMNAGYEWNELELANNFNYQLVEPTIGVNVIAYVDGVKTNAYPTSCNYVAELSEVINGEKVSLPNSYVNCDRQTNKWKLVIEGFAEQIIINFTYLQGMPLFTYTGEYELVNEDSLDWKIKFLTSGTLIFPELVPVLDVFLVGGGGAGYLNSGSTVGTAGGGGGYTKTVKKVIALSRTEYNIVIGSGGSSSGAAGKESSAFGYIAAGGKGAYNITGGKGGSGGAAGNGTTVGVTQGGTNGGNGGSTSSWSGGKGQIAVPGPNGETGNTREFGEDSGDIYSYGGNGGGNRFSPLPDNKGYGGSGNRKGWQKGGSGVVIIRRNFE